MDPKPSHPMKADKSPTGKSAAAGKKKEKLVSETKGKWNPSTVLEDHLQFLVSLGYLLQPEVAIPHSLVTVKEDESFTRVTVPETKPHERVCFIPFVLRGLSFPIHPFFQGLLHFYGLQIHHLSPNSIPHIACYIMVCECFLGVEPHFGLWRKYFEVKRQTNGDETSE